MKTSNILRNPSKTEITNVIDQNGSDCWNTLLDFLDTDDFLKRSEIAVNNGVSKCFTGINHPFGNIFWGANFSEQEVKEKVNTLVIQSKKRNIPFMWFVGALSKPHNLGDYLVKVGLTKFESPGMYLNLRDLDRKKYQDALDYSKIIIVRVSNLKEEDYWSDLSSTIFEMDDVRVEINHIWRLLLKFCDGYLAIHEGKPVGISMVFYSSGVAGIYNVGVCPAYRKQGIGTALTMAPLIQAKKRGYEISILQSSLLGFKVYTQIGFKECCKYETYLYTPANQNEENNGKI